MKMAKFGRGAKALAPGTPKLDDLLESGAHETIIRHRSDTDTDTDTDIDTDESRSPGWYEKPDDPWHVQWWSGAQWTGLPVPFTTSMLAAKSALRRRNTHPRRSIRHQRTSIMTTGRRRLIIWFWVLLAVAAIGVGVTTLIFISDIVAKSVTLILVGISLGLALTRLHGLLRKEPE